MRNGIKLLLGLTRTHLNLVIIHLYITFKADLFFVAFKKVNYLSHFLSEMGHNLRSSSRVFWRCCQPVLRKSCWLSHEPVQDDPALYQTRHYISDPISYDKRLFAFLQISWIMSRSFSWCHCLPAHSTSCPLCWKPAQSRRILSTGDFKFMSFDKNNREELQFMPFKVKIKHHYFSTIVQYKFVFSRLSFCKQKKQAQFYFLALFSLRTKHPVII